MFDTDKKRETTFDPRLDPAYDLAFDPESMAIDEEAIEAAMRYAESQFDACDTDSLPIPVATMSTGPILAMALSGIDVDRLSGPDRIEVLLALQRMVNHFQAAAYSVMATITTSFSDEIGDHPGEAEMCAAAEIGSALNLTRRAAEAELSLALSLTERLPRVLAMLERGDIDARRARAIDLATIHLDTDDARRVFESVADAAPGLTTGQLRQRISKAAIDVDPDAARDRFEMAVDQRRVIMEATDDGTANLMGLDLSPAAAAAASRHITWLAKGLKASDDPRTMDQVRADVLIDLLTGGSGSSPTAGDDACGMVDIRVDLATLAELNDHSGDLAGYGPVIADIARQVAAQSSRAEWRYVVTDPITGSPVSIGTTRRRPGRKLRRYVEAMHPTCVFPGCRMPARESDLDHRVPWANGGATEPGNLLPLCRYHHRIKGECGWTYTVRDDGSIKWTSRLGRTYITPRPPP